MWWQWLLLIVCAGLIIGCNVDTALAWKRGKTGPFGPHAENWWGCAVFTILLGIVMVWIGTKLL